MAMVAPLRFILRAVAASRMQYVMPRLVAFSRPSEPPMSTGLPVTMAGTAWPTFIEYVSMNHAMVCAFVLTSGAGMSMFSPMMTWISLK
jgi:hypothetical protein